MTDVHSKEMRSYNMSQIKGKNTKPEILVRKFLFANGFRYRLHDKKLPGKPDIVLSKYKTVIFINGCFWHGHQGCKKFIMPKSNVSYWQPKIQRNIDRDQLKCAELKKEGWNVLVIWECELKSDKINNNLNSLVKKINNCN